MKPYKRCRLREHYACIDTQVSLEKADVVDVLDTRPDPMWLVRHCVEQHKVLVVGYTMYRVLRNYCKNVGWGQKVTRGPWQPSPLSPVPTSNNVEATLSKATSRTILSTKSNVASTLLPFLATMLFVSVTTSNEISSFRQSRNKLNTNRQHCCNNVEATFDFGNTAECCVDIVAGVDRALCIDVRPC